MRHGICLETGAKGFLGSEIVRQIVAAHLPVRATDKNPESKTPAMDYRPADILELSSTDSLFSDVTHVIHVAGLAHIFNKTQAVVAPFNAVNEQGTANMCRVAAKAGVGHFLLISSVSVYGPSTQGMYDENAPYLPVGFKRRASTKHNNVQSKLRKNLECHSRFYVWRHYMEETIRVMWHG